MKLEYTKPSILITAFETEDIITTSSTTSGGSSSGSGSSSKLNINESGDNSFNFEDIFIPTE